MVIEMSMPPIEISIQGSSLNSFWGWNSSFSPAEPTITTSRIVISR